jgi:hypothetical protein
VPEGPESLLPIGFGGCILTEVQGSALRGHLISAYATMKFRDPGRPRSE